MKANEFIEKYGLDVAKSIIAAAPVTASSYRVSMNNHLGLGGLYGRIESASGPVLSLSDIKRLVESHELIESCGGIHMARADVMDLDGFEKTSPYWMKIKQAILDVESCQ